MYCLYIFFHNPRPNLFAKVYSQAKKRGIRNTLSGFWCIMCNINKSACEFVRLFVLFCLWGHGKCYTHLVVYCTI